MRAALTRPRSERRHANAGSVNEMNDQTLVLPIPDEVLDAIADRVASIVVERLGDELRPPTARWMRTNEAAEYLGLSRGALYERIGRIPHHKIDRMLLFRRDDLDAWLAEHRREPDQPQTWVRPPSPSSLRPRPRRRSAPVKLLPIGRTGSDRRHQDENEARAPVAAANLWRRGSEKALGA